MDLICKHKVDKVDFYIIKVQCDTIHNMQHTSSVQKMTGRPDNVNNCLSGQSKTCLICNILYKGQKWNLLKSF